MRLDDKKLGTVDTPVCCGKRNRVRMTAGGETFGNRGPLGPASRERLTALRSGDSFDRFGPKAKDRRVRQSNFRNKP